MTKPCFCPDPSTCSLGCQKAGFPPRLWPPGMAPLKPGTTVKPDATAESNQTRTVRYMTEDDVRRIVSEELRRKFPRLGE